MNSTMSIIPAILFIAQQNQIDNLTPLPEISDNSIRCYGVYGCFPVTGDPWITELRARNEHPSSPEVISPRFPVFTKNSRTHPKFIDINDPFYVNKLGIDPKGTIYFVTHGFLDSGDKLWIQQILNALLDQDKEGTATVIGIDWRNGSHVPYLQAVANIRVVGAIAAHLINFLKEELKIKNLDKVHMIGHSLGAHLCGYAGHALQRDFNLTLGRITGLDPAEHQFSDVEPEVRLEKSDAKFVDIVHSDIKPISQSGFGMIKPIGHIDFYPNGGLDNPGCDYSYETYMSRKGTDSPIQKLISCAHTRSYKYFTDSISHPECPYMAISCESYEDFKLGNCFECNADNHNCFEFGFNSYKSYMEKVKKNANIYDEDGYIKAYLLTGEKAPFCRSHYRTTVFISSSDESVAHRGDIGLISMVIKSRNQKSTEKLVMSKESIYYEPGTNYTVIVPGTEIGIPEYATINWEYSVSLNPFTWRINTPYIYVDYVYIESLEHNTRLRLCPETKEPIRNGKGVDFKEEYCKGV